MEMASSIPPPIAIIGSGCRLPGGISDTAKLWDILLDPPDLSKEVPHDRFRWEGFYRLDGRHNAIRTKSAYFLDDNLRHFDPHFFGISPSEAETMDPQQRLLLETVYDTMESAGLTLEGLRGSDTGVFVGQMFDDYHEFSVLDPDAAGGRMLTTGTVRSITANRISHVFDFRGPSMSIDTACSSSMVAVHLAVDSLRRGESNVAFACGVNLIMMPTVFKAGSKMKMFSSDGRSKMFDESADGYGRGEGIGVLCLKRLDLAIRDGDCIESVIRHTGTNHDGRSQTLTAPSAEAQAQLIRETYRNAGLDLSQPSSRPSYFEAHGTGTRVGDPAEAEAIESAIFSPDYDPTDDKFLYIGSIKTVVGHTEGTAGIASLLRASLAIKHGVIPPNLHFQRMNLKIGAQANHLRVATAAQPWPDLPKNVPRRASVNSFGFGGTNVHAILENFEASPPTADMPTDSPKIDDIPCFTPFVFSGISENALKLSLERYLRYLRQKQDIISLRDLAWTLMNKRSIFEFRYFVAADSHGELAERLSEKINAISENQKAGAARHTDAFIRGNDHGTPKILAIFSGQGAQYAAMAKHIIESSSYASGIIDKLDNALSTLPAEDRPQWTLKNELLLQETQSRVNETAMCQPLTTAVQILLVHLLEAAGIELTAVVGHSSGEIGAAFASGVISAEEAICNAYYRGLHSSRRGNDGKHGGMLVVSMPVDDTVAICRLPNFSGRIAVAAVNSPYNVTLSGNTDVIKEAKVVLDGAGIATKQLLVDKAYHSHHMLDCSEHYKTSLQHLNIESTTENAGTIPWFSSVNPGSQMTSVTAEHWSNNMVQTVMFKDAIETAIKQTGTPDLILEVGPQPVLGRAVQETIAEADGSSTVYTALLKRDVDSIQSFSEAIGFIWSHFGRKAVNNMAGLDQKVSMGTKPKLVKNLPTYSWKHDKEYWWKSRYMRKQLHSTTAPQELLGNEVSLSANHEAKWRQFLDPRNIPWILDHRVDGSFVLPAAAHLIMVTAAAQSKYGHCSIASMTVTDVKLQHSILFASERAQVETVLTMYKLDNTNKSTTGSFVIDFCSDQEKGELVTAARGEFCITFGQDQDRTYPKLTKEPKKLTEVKPDLHYRHASEKGLDYTGSFRNITSARRRIDYATGEISIMPSELVIHPAVLDGLFQGASIAGNFPADTALPDFLVPSRIRRIIFFPKRCSDITDRGNSINFQALKTGQREASGSLYQNGAGVAVQVDGLVLSPYRLTTAKDDVAMYAGLTWECIDGMEHNDVEDSDLTEPEHVDGIRPSLPSTTCSKSKDTLMILGGATPETDSLAAILECALSLTFKNTIRISSLEDIEGVADIPSAVLSLLELEEPIFLNMTGNRWKAFQRLLCDATDILWVTTGTKSPKNLVDIYANMMVGVVRSVRHELRSLRIQLFNVDHVGSVTAQNLTAAMRHWHMSREIVIKESSGYLFHPELSFEDDLLYSPVTVRIGAMNDRYNSQHRITTRKAVPSEEPIKLIKTEPKRYSLLESPRIPSTLGQEDCTVVKMFYCTQFAFKIKGLGFLHLGIGLNTEDEMCLVAVDKMRSITQVPRSLVFPCDLSGPPNSRYLETVLGEIIARAVCDMVNGNTTLVLVCSESTWISVIERKAQQESKSVVFVTSLSDTGSTTAIHIHNDELDVLIQDRIPSDTSTISIISNHWKDERLFKRMKGVLKDHQVTFKGTNATFRPDALRKQGNDDSLGAALDLLKRTTTDFVYEIVQNPETGSYPTITPQDIVNQPDQAPSTILNWTTTSHVQVPVRTATHAVRFYADKTYLIVGSSEIARSICEWMAKSGARFLVLVSRNTARLAEWRKDMADRGVSLQLHSLDITDEESVRRMISAVKAPDVECDTKFPPFGGVVHLASIFKDGAFSNMSYEAFKTVADVKAKGSLIIHKLLSDVPLDFFILTSSISYITGNPGQANYNAGNSFVASLARYRRSIGLPASVVHLGTIFGLGHFFRQVNGSLMDRDARKALYPISERDLHQIFAEAVLASPVDSGVDPEIITGLRDVKRSMEARSPYVGEPMFRNIVRDDEALDRSSTFSRLNRQVSPRDQLASAIRSDESPSEVGKAVFRVIQAAFGAKLRALLQVDCFDEKKSVVDLGMDSLALSEMRGWARKEFGVKIIGSVAFEGNVRDLVLWVVKELDREWVLKS